MACDHIIPLSMGGGSIYSNLHIVCGRCNTRKGPLTDEDYKKLLKSLACLSEDTVKYVLRKLAKSEVFWNISGSIKTPVSTLLLTLIFNNKTHTYFP